MPSKKSPNPIDIHVGSRVRLRRMMLGMSQEKLGESLGITFQQIQKYEKGTNRIGASRLQHIATVLKVPVSFFFEDAPGTPEEAEGFRRNPAHLLCRRLPVLLGRPVPEQGFRADRRSESPAPDRRSGAFSGRRRLIKMHVTLDVAKNF